MILHRVADVSTFTVILPDAHKSEWRPLLPSDLQVQSGTVRHLVATTSPVPAAAKPAR
jgi:hypothetical protein